MRRAKPWLRASAARVCALIAADIERPSTLKVVRDAIKEDPRIAGRLALWGRRLVGEALSQAQQVAVERDAMASLLVGGVGGSNRPSADLAELGRMFARLTDEHTRRMGRLGLAA